MLGENDFPVNIPNFTTFIKLFISKKNKSANYKFAYYNLYKSALGFNRLEEIKKEKKENKSILRSMSQRDRAKIALFIFDKHCDENVRKKFHKLYSMAVLLE